MINFLQKWLKILIQELSINQTQANLLETQYSPKNTYSLKIAQFLNLLNGPLFILGILFALWLLIDFFLQFSLTPLTYQTISQLSTPWVNIIGPATVGYWTNWLAIKMLFYPRFKNAVWQGLIPARRDELVATLASGISQNLFSPEIVRRYLEQSNLISKFTTAVANIGATSDFRDELKKTLRKLMLELINAPATQRTVYETTGKVISAWRAENLLEMPIELTKNVWGPIIQQKIAETLPVIPEALDESFRELDHWLDNLPDLLNEKQLTFEKIITWISEELVRLLDVPKIIKQQLAGMDEAALEKLLTGNVSSELTFIQTSGGIFGLALALAIYYPLLRLILIILIIGLYFLYQKTKSIPLKK